MNVDVIESARRMRLLCSFFVFSTLFVRAQSTVMTPATAYAYRLPYPEGRSYLLVQGYNSRLSHRGELALDFKMRKGSPVCAMRDGVVQEVREDSNRGGLKRKHFADGNYIQVRHADHSYAWYFHLQKDGALVNPGDTIRAGQVIGRSGNTGYSAFPHLHVELVMYREGAYTQVPMVFLLSSGIRRLKPLHFYRNRVPVTEAIALSK
jgi:murein DD-endopeptidase MepM/ murein hydrolase activator NlpD